MSNYTKLFNSILASTVWSEPNHVRIVWITMLAMSNRDGIVEGSVPGLAVFARLSTDETREALTRLLGPDTDSRSKEQDGRRIEAIDGGWRLINHHKYRQLMSLDERREYLRMRKREERARRKAVSPQSTNVNNVADKSTMSTHTDTYTYTKASQKQEDPSKIQVIRNSVNPTEREKGPGNTSLSPAALSDPFTDPHITERAGRFMERYQSLYQQYRKGARYAVKPIRDYSAAVTLCQTWPDDSRLDKIAIVFLTTDNKFAEEGSRTLSQFLALASWCDGRLAEWEETNNTKP